MVIVDPLGKLKTDTTILSPAFMEVAGVACPTLAMKRPGAMLPVPEEVKVPIF